MEITNININFITQKGSLIGFASCLIDGVLELKSIGIHTRLNQEGVRATFPARKLPDGQLQFFYRIIDKETEEELIKKIEKEINRLGLYNFKEIEKDE